MSRFSRRRFVLAAGASLGAPLSSLAQQKVARVGFLFAGTLAQRPQSKGLWDALQELGYTSGKNLVIEVREGKGKVEQLPQFAQELVRWKPDVIVAVTPVAILAAQRATTTIPIVMAIMGNPEPRGVVRNLARPEGNITGPVIVFDASLTAKQLQFLKEMIPTLSHVGLLWNADLTASIPERLLQMAASLGVELRPLPYRGPDNLADALKLSVGSKVQAMVVAGDPVSFDRRADIASFAAANRLPTAHLWRDEVTEGGLLAYGLSVYKEYRRVAPYVDKLLKGAKPADLPIEQQRKWELFINMKTAKALGIKVPQSLLLAADELIE
jgi:putative ABC transport system substrate-binding protein